MRNVNRMPTMAPRRTNPDASISLVGDDRRVEYFFASNASAFINTTNRVLFLEDDDVAAVDADGNLKIHRLDKLFHASRKLSGDVSEKNDESAAVCTNRAVITLRKKIDQIVLGPYESFLQKEIFEQPETVLNTLRGRVDFDKGEIRLGGIREYLSHMRRCRRIVFVGSGTSQLAALAAREIAEQFSQISIEVEESHSFLDRACPLTQEDLCVFISQSGETMETVKALMMARGQREPKSMCMGVTNVVGSTICRESPFGIHINAGPEVGVSSTKAYTSQVVSLILFALALGSDSKMMQPKLKETISALKMLPVQLRTTLNDLNDTAKALAVELHREKSILVMGRGLNLATCYEGALKIKEIAELQAEAISLGELKHGPLAMIDAFQPVVMIMVKDHVYDKCLNALEQILARNGRPIVICTEGDEEVARRGLRALPIPASQCVYVQSVLAIIPLQLLAYHIAVLKGRNVDCKRPWMTPDNVELE